MLMWCSRNIYNYYRCKKKTQLNIFQ